MFAALDIDDTTIEAAQVYFLLAAAIGAPADDWAVVAGDAPCALVRRDGHTLSVGWEPVVDGHAITRVALFAMVADAARGAVEIDDPVEVNRLCVDALGLLDDCDAALQHLAADPAARYCVHRIFRNLHTIKGATRGTAALEKISSAAHHAEDAIEILRHGEEALASVLPAVRDALRSLRAAISAARPRGEVDDAMTELLVECRPVLVDLQLAVNRFSDYDVSAVDIAKRGVERIRVASERADMRSLLAQCEVTARAIDHIAAGGDVTPAALDDIAALDRQIELYAAVYRELAAADHRPSLLVTMTSWTGSLEDRNGSFASLASTLTCVPSLREALADPTPLARRRVRAVLADVPAMFEPGRPRDEAAIRFDRVHSELQSALVTLERAAPAAPLGELRAIIERLSWIPLAGLGRRLLRMTRQLAAELGKEVTADIAFGDLTAAPDLARVLGEILVHAIRNAIDHGIEPPAERVAAGKPAAGAIHVAAYAVIGRVVVTVRDDGRGVALDRVRRQAISRGLRTVSDMALATDADLLELLFHPGFSTAAAVTSVSGRGVGMDVIRSLAQERNGTAVLSSSPGHATELTIDVPLEVPELPVSASPSESRGGVARRPRTSNRPTLPYSR
jgi:two-component system chemotaxis sensor kinase CheA